MTLRLFLGVTVHSKSINFPKSSKIPTEISIPPFFVISSNTFNSSTYQTIPRTHWNSLNLVKSDNDRQLFHFPSLMNAKECKLKIYLKFYHLHYKFCKSSEIYLILTTL